MNQNHKLVIVVLATAVVVGTGTYLWQNNRTRMVPSQPVAQTVVQKQMAPSVAGCSRLGSSWALFSTKETSLSFCYKKSWGDPELKETTISPQARVGTAYHVSFSQSVGNYPLISYSTLDFQKTGDSDGGSAVNWKALDLNKNEQELAALFSDTEKVVLKKMTVNGKAALKVNQDFISQLSLERMVFVSYFVPSVSIDGKEYNLHIIGSPEQEADLGVLLGTMVF